MLPRPSPLGLGIDKPDVRSAAHWHRPRRAWAA